LGLENLKSIFTDDFESRASDFQSNAPLLGESIVVGMSSTYGVPESIGGLFNKSTTYDDKKFTPMSSLNVPSIEQILENGNYGDGYPTKLSSYSKLTILQPEPGNGISFSPAGEDLRAVDGLGDLISDITTNRKSPSNTSWSNLYDSNHKSKGVGINYSPNVRSVFSIRDEAPNVRGISRNAFLGLGAGEPYIISNLPSGDIGGLDGGRLQNFASRSIPIVRALTDVVRLGKYLTSASGLLNIVLPNVHSVIPSVVVRNDKDDLMKVPQRFKVNYNPLSTILSAGSRLLGTTPNVLFDRTEPSLASLGLDIFSKPTYSGFGGKVPNTVQETFERGTTKEQPGFLDQLGSVLSSLGTGGVKVPKKITGDKMTLAPMIKGNSLDAIDDDKDSATPNVTFGLNSQNKLGFDIESKDNGMPFYFKDLRDDTYIFFRAYIDGLTENISPSWSPTNYLGRSEPVYVYERSERDISFNLKLFAQTGTELESIYKKMNRLTSLCYPEYMADVNLGGKIKMKPPLTKFRLGELFGSENAELTGFIKSLSYTYPSESPWETEAGRRVPKYVQVAITYQVIHTTVPSLAFATSTDETFYGINKEESVGVE